MSKNPDHDQLGTRMKEYEAQECSRRFIPMLPIYARIDGRGFSRFTKGLERPYDKRMSDAMVETTKYLVEQTHAKIGYTQSDEISLAWYAPVYDSEVFFDGRVSKMTSVLASLATAAFTRALLNSPDATFRSYVEKMPHFDARVISMPTKTEVANMFVWRNQDATKNAVSMAAHSCFSHKSLQGVNTAEMQERLFQEYGINFNDYPEFFKRGSFVRRVVVERSFTQEELEKIPPKHRPPAGALVKRNSIDVIPMPIFSKVVNREAVIFDGAEPQLHIEG